MAKWLDKYDAPQAQNGIEGTMGGLTDVGFNYNGAWGGTMQMGGVLPGAVGFMYARTQSPAPSNGPYAKKTKASAQNGQEMKYYQAGLDFKPKTISQDGSRTPIIVSDPRDRRLTRYNDSLTLYNNYIRTKAAFDAALGNPSSPKVQVDIESAKNLPYIRNRNRFEMPDSSSTVFPLSPHEAVTAPQRETRFEGRKVSRPQVGTVNFPRYTPYFSTLIDPINIIRYNQNYGYYVKDKDYKGDVSSISKNTLDDFKYIKNSKQRAAKLKEYPYTLYPNKPNLYDFIEEYAKPVQPVILEEKEPKFEKPIPIPRDTRDLGYTLPTPGQFTAPKLYKYNPDTPTKFSFTYPTGGYNKQKTMYFPSKSALKSFVGGIRDASYQEGKDYATATGTLQDGGDIPVDPMGYWNPENVGSPVIIPSNVITMEGVDQPLLGISDTGDVQYMEPGEDYEFDGEYVTEYPVAQKGKTIPAPTTADSARLYNAQVALNKFYENEMKAGRIKKQTVTDVYNFTPLPTNEHTQGLRKANLDFYRGAIQFRKNTNTGVYDDAYEKYFNLSPEQVKQLEYKGLAQTKGGSEYQDYYRDMITPQQNLAAPFALVDYRIRPQRQIAYNPINESVGYYPGGNVQVYDYDPLAVKPYNMRTPQEKIEWEKKYGKKETTKAKPTPPPAKKKMVASTPETVRQTIPPAAIPSSTSSTKSVSEKVGMLDMFGKKDVELLVDNFGNHEWFRKDDDIGDLKPIRRATREEIEYSKKQKQRNGGVNKADEYSIEKLDQLLNFTNYNKPTKGGWLDKYN